MVTDKFATNRNEIAVINWLTSNYRVHMHRHDMQTRDMYLHFTRSNVWANGNR